MSPKDPFRQSDVTFWGVVALVFGASALLFANLSVVLPKNTLMALHSPRLDGGNLNLLRTQVADLRDEAVRMRNENNRLVTMITLAEQDQGAMTRRVGAIESTLPVLLENTQNGSNIDRSILTSGIDAAPVLSEVEGGSVAISTTPLEGTAPQPTSQIPSTNQGQPQPRRVDQPKPAPLMPQIVANAGDPAAFGVALGPQVTVRDAFVAWKDITSKAGPLLLGLGPLLSGNAGADNQRLVAGPIDDYVRAEQVCVRMIRIGISCLPVPYAGQSLPQ